MHHRLLAIFFTIVLYATIGNQLGSPNWFMLLTIILVSYNAFEIYHYIYSGDQNLKLYLSPTVITSTFVLSLGYGITNVLFITSWFDLLPLGVLDGKQISNEMSKLVLLAIIASLGLWIGHYSKLAMYFQSENFKYFVVKILPCGDTPRDGALLIALTFSIVAKIAQENFGLFGYCSTLESLMAGKNYSYYLTIFSNFGKLGLIISSLTLFCQIKKSKKYIYWIASFWLTETLFGIVSASKTNILSPTLIIFLCYVLSVNKLKFLRIAGMAFTMCVLIFAAFPFVDAYRESVIKNQRDGNGACSSLRSTLTVTNKILEIDTKSLLSEDRVPKYLNKSEDRVPKYLNKSEENRLSVDGQMYSAHDGSVIGKILARFNFSFIGSYGLIYSDEIKEKRVDHILRDIALSPLYAWIPRFIWESKPISDMGVFYNRKILGTDSNSSTGMGSITYLYMGGGVTLVFLGYLLIGVTQKAFFSLVFTKNRIAGKTIFLMLLANFAFIESVVSAYIVDFFRLIPIWILVLHIFFKLDKIK